MLFCLPAGWTDVASADPFVVTADGRCPFTVGGLLALADLIDRLRSQPVPLENRIFLVTCESWGCQAARVYSLIRPLRTGWRWIGSRSRSATGRLVFGQDGAQVPLAEDQHAVEELSAQGADEALAGCIHARRLDGGAQDPGAGGLENGVEGCGEVRSAVADQELIATRGRTL